VHRRICPFPSRTCSPVTEPVSSREPVLFPGHTASSPSMCERHMFRPFSHVVVDHLQNRCMDASSCCLRLSVVPRAPVGLSDRTCSPSCTVGPDALVYLHHRRTYMAPLRDRMSVFLPCRCPRQLPTQTTCLRSVPPAWYSCPRIPCHLSHAAHLGRLCSLAPGRAARSPPQCRAVSLQCSMEHLIVPFLFASLHGSTERPAPWQ
jgi:hypothetical protein